MVFFPINKDFCNILLWLYVINDGALDCSQISPEGAQKHAQQSAIAADALMGEIGKCCRDLFTNAHKEGIQLPSAVVGLIKTMKPIESHIHRNLPFSWAAISDSTTLRTFG